MGNEFRQALFAGIDIGIPLLLLSGSISHHLASTHPDATPG